VSGLLRHGDVLAPALPATKAPGITDSGNSKGRNSTMNRKKIILAVVAIALAIQAIPYGRNHTNPPVVREPAWDSPTTRELARRACFDCHSNESVWPWYSKIAPTSWLVAFDVYEGRKELNFSDWRDGAREGEQARKIMKEVNSGDMPPLQYRLVHPEAKLDPAARKRLSEGLGATANKINHN